MVAAEDEVCGFLERLSCSGVFILDNLGSLEKLGKNEYPHLEDEEQAF